MLGRRWDYVLCLVCSLFPVGCFFGDPVRTTSQSVRLRVVDSASGRPVAGAQVSLKDDFETREPLSKETRQPPELWHKHYREFWEGCPWFHGETDEDGQAGIEVEYSSLDRSRGSRPPAERDWVTGKPFLVRVMQGQTPEEELSLLMKPGESLKGKSFAVTVIDIQGPRYVETENGQSNQ